jgi:hypothetical protein
VGWERERVIWGEKVLIGLDFKLRTNIKKRGAKKEPRQVESLDAKIEEKNDGEETDC